VLSFLLFAVFVELSELFAGDSSICGRGVSNYERVSVEGCEECGV